MVIPFFNVVLMSDKDENAINNEKHFVLFHLSKYFEKLYGNIVYKMQNDMSNFLQVPSSFIFAAIWGFSGFSGLTTYKLITTVTASLVVFLIEINNKKLDQAISKLLTLSKYFTSSLILSCACETFVNISWGLRAVNNVLTNVYLNELIKIDELIKLVNQ